MKPNIPKGTRDFPSTEVAKRNYIINIIKNTFETFGFQPIETPSFENYTTLMGKYGEEGDRLIFKILNSGDYLKDIQDITTVNYKKLTPKISAKALRYDLTVPFARYVVQHQNELVFPFKRYQIQPVWRADRPQKGRFREFLQCDADVVGSNSLLQEIECIQLYDSVFNKLGLNEITIKINNRKILSGIAEVIKAKCNLIDFTVALDKLDKIGKEQVIHEMISKGISKEAIEKMSPLFSFSGSNDDKISSLKTMLQTSEEGLKGLEEIEFIIKNSIELGLKSSVLQLDVTLARGLNYYTGTIFEVSPPATVKMGSIGGGGRYDNLTDIFGLNNMSGIGISFGLDRIYLVLEELQLLKTVELPKPKVLFINFGEKEALYSMKAISYLRKEGIKTEIYPEASKMKKQMNYANKRNIPFVVLVGSLEIEKQEFTLKNMKTSEQITCNLEMLKNSVNLHL